ncbi:hypothetical protein GGI07_002451 [Coemansia sp. Benny D115]|nr:hypothetical protein GGI07_002451 [Coemansia sp. Benny D115]
MHGNRLVYQNHKDESLDSQDDSDDVPSDKVRAGVQWLGLCMGSNTGLSLSEYGALVEAFPNLRSIYVDMGSLDTRAKSIEGVILGAHKTVTLSTLRLKTKGTAGKPTFRALIKHAAHSLEYLDLGPVDTADACRVLWGDDTSGSFVSAVTGGSVSDWRPRVRFPRLRRLYFSVFGGESDSVTTPVPVCCQFPLLEELCYRVFEP